MNQIVFVGKHMLTYSVSRHVHSSWEFIYCTGGSGTLEFDGLSLPYREGDIAIIPPGLPHENLSSDGFTNIHINMDDPRLSLDCPIILRGNLNQLILDAFTGAYYFYNSAPEERAAPLSAYGDLLVALLALRCESPSRSRIVAEIENSIINSYPDCGYELDTYLHSLPFSYDYLRKLFKKETGVTPHQYLSEKRLQAAADFLSSTGAGTHNISELARMCGFREALYFSRMFKNRFGVSPTHYQRECSKQAPIPGGSSDSMKIML